MRQQGGKRERLKRSQTEASEIERLVKQIDEVN